MNDYPDLPNNTLLTIEELATFFRLKNARTLNRWIDEGKLPVETVGKGKGKRVVRKSLLNWLDSERTAG